MKPTSVRLSPELATKLDIIAAALDRPRSWVIEQALHAYVTEQEQIIADVQHAQADLRAGKGRPWSAVKADMRQILDEHTTTTP